MKPNSSRCFLFLISLFVFNYRAKISYPTLTCDSSIDTDVCFEHDGEQQTAMLRGYSCNAYKSLENTTLSGTVICDFNLFNGEYSCVNETFQNLIKSNIISNS